MFELLSAGLIDYMVDVIRGRGIRFGIGGVARLGKGLISPELIMSEHVRLGSSQVLLSRDFNGVFDASSRSIALEEFRREISVLRERVRVLESAGADVLSANSLKLKWQVGQIVHHRMAYKGESVLLRKRTIS